MSPAEARTQEPPTTIAVLTPAGRSAIASLRLAGPGATEHLVASFRPHAKIDWQRLETGRILVGFWRGALDAEPVNSAPPAAGGADGEELVVCKIRDNEFEIHCHGGPAAQQHIVNTLLESGCREVGWTDIPYQPNEPRWRRQARIAMSYAPTERTALILLDQYDGALIRSIDHVELHAQNAQWDSVRSELECLVRRARVGRHCVAPWQVVLAGPPNVGKSRLINALVGFERTVVFDTPGTTRDVVRVRCAMDGWPIELSDTAGLRQTQDELEAAGIQRTEQRLASADLVLWTMSADGSRTDTSCPHVTEMSRHLTVITKADLARSPDDLVPESTTCVITSAETGEGIERLMKRIVETLIPEPLRPGDACPHTPEQQRALQAALVAAEARDITQLHTACSLLRR